jgi:hypothetical protein
MQSSCKRLHTMGHCTDFTKLKMLENVFLVKKKYSTEFNEKPTDGQTDGRHLHIRRSCTERFTTD